MLSPPMASEQTPPTRVREARYPQFHVLLKPLSHPELGDIRIEDDLFAVGRTEPPFASYGRVVAAEMSRRHARIFAERGAVFVADMGSKNGTSVNGVGVRHRPRQLRSGDELRFGGTLAYRVELLEAKATPLLAPTLCCLTLTPVRDDLGLQPIVITRFPFLVSKTDEAFARYRNDYPHQVNYLSRRHAHIFLHGSSPCVEDLGSTNGTFLDGKRLDEHAAALAEGNVIAFGGTHFAYRVSVREESESTLTRVLTPPDAPSSVQDIDKTTFVGAADSFLDIFCVDGAQERGEPDGAGDAAATPADETRSVPEPPRRNTKWVKRAAFLAELREAFGRGDATRSKRVRRWAAAGIAGVAIAGVGLYLWGSPQRDMEHLLASGDYAGATALARTYLASHPQDEAAQALGAEALIKANLPAWLTALQAGAYDRARASVATMTTQAASNPDALALIREIAWVGDLQQVVATRGGLDAPIPIFGGDDPGRALVQRWEEDSRGHQRALSRIATFVPEFKERHALALSQLRKLESDDSVYLSAIERLKGTILAKLEGNATDELEAVFSEYAERYPRLRGLDDLRRDLAAYRQVESETRDGALGALVAGFSHARMTTPLFQQESQRLRASRLPPPEALQRYQAAAEAWRKGAATDAIAALQGLGAGPWSGAVDEELKHKRFVAEQFAALKLDRGGDFRERLLAFYGVLDPEDDAFFAAALSSDLNTLRAEALSRAKAVLVRAKTAWDRYQHDGAISAEQRREAEISPAFRTQASLLTQARRDATQGMRLLAHLKSEEAVGANQWTALRDDIEAQARLQRRAIAELRPNLDTQLLQAKLALLGG